MPCFANLDLSPAPPAGAHLSRYWTMDEGGNATKLDSTASVPLPLVAGTSAGAGLFNNGTRFDPSFFGGHGLITTSNPQLTTTGAVGISYWFWFKFNAYEVVSSQGVHFFLWGFDTNPASYGEFDILFGSDGNLANSFFFAQVCSSNPVPCDQSPTYSVVPALGTWHMLAGTYDTVNHVMKLYYDGVMVSTAPSTQPFFPSTALTIWFADYKLNTTSNPDVNVDELGVCLEGVLTQAQITSLFNGGAGVTWPGVKSIVPYP